MATSMTKPVAMPRFTTRNSTKSNGITDEIFLSVIYGDIYRQM